MCFQSVEEIHVSLELDGQFLLWYDIQIAQLLDGL